MNIDTSIHLSENEQMIVKKISPMRFSNARSIGTANKKIGDQSNSFVDLNGFGGEFAFCKLFNLFPNFDLRPDKKDVILKGNNIDVKTTEYDKGCLIARYEGNVNNKKNIDYFALMIGKFPNYEFRGFMKASELLQDEKIKDLGHGKTFLAKQNELIFEIQRKNDEPVRNGEEKLYSSKTIVVEMSKKKMF